MTTARALRVPRTGGGEVLTVDTVEVADPGPGEIRVRVEASGVNFIDVYHREGRYPLPLPFTLGVEGAGVVESVGAGVAGPAVGDRVAWAMRPGSACELVVLPADAVVPVPDGVSGDQAAAAMLQGMTAHFLLNSAYAVQPGDPILVHAAAGGVGQWLVQLGAAKGAVIVATAGSDDKLAKAADLGATHTINYRETDDLAAAVRAALGGAGVAVAYDGVGKDTFDASLAATRPRGLVVLFGAASGAVPPFDLQRLNSGGSLFVTRPTLGHYIADRDELLWRSGDIFTALAEGTVRLEIGGRYPLEDAAAAYQALEGRQTTGKLVLTL